MATFNYAEIPAGVQTIIKNLQEIVGGDISDEEVYAVLRECGMDPNAAVEQLLAQDPFQKVKRKKDKKKENTSHKKLMEARSRTGRGSNASGTTYARGSVLNDGGVKSNDTDQAAGKIIIGTHLKIQQINESSSITLLANNRPDVNFGSTSVEGAPQPSSNLKKDSDEVLECSFPSDSMLRPLEETRVSEKFDAIKQQVSSRSSLVKANATTACNLSKEWKLKDTNPSISFAAASVNSGDQPHPTTSVPRVRVIFPSHLHVPESVRLGLTFGSFGDDFKPSSVLGIERSPVQYSGSHQVTAEPMEDDSRIVHESRKNSESQEEDTSPTLNLSRISSVLSTPAPPMTQSVGPMQSSIHVTQQSVHIFRTPTGVQVSHFPVNYAHYGQDMTPGQQNQDSVMWIPAHDFANMPGASFYNMSVHGQNVQLMPPQTNLYHPSQTMTTAAGHSGMDIGGGVDDTSQQDGQNNSPDGH